MAQPNPKRYLVRSSPDGEVLTLRGHSLFVPKLVLALGVLAAAGGVAGIIGVASKHNDMIALGVGIAGVLGAIGALAFAVPRIRTPRSLVIVDKRAMTLTVRRDGVEPTTIRFQDLGTMKVAPMAIVTGRRGGAVRTVAAVGLSAHPGVVLYEPWTEGDLATFAVTLRQIVGEEYLPRAQPKAQKLPS
jgi:hypothetical protein